jgi:hypothetical protein
MLKVILQEFLSFCCVQWSTRTYLRIFSKSVSNVNFTQGKSLGAMVRYRSYRADNPIILNNTGRETVPSITLDLNEGSWKRAWGLSCINLKYRATSWRISSSPKETRGSEGLAITVGDIDRASTNVSRAEQDKFLRTHCSHAVCVPIRSHLRFAVLHCKHAVASLITLRYTWYSSWDLAMLIIQILQ